MLADPGSGLIVFLTFEAKIEAAFRERSHGNNEREWIRGDHDPLNKSDASGHRRGMKRAINSTCEFPLKFDGFQLFKKRHADVHTCKT